MRIAAAGTIGKVRRDPMAMLPFCGYNMADYWGHWLEIGKAHGKTPGQVTLRWLIQQDVIAIPRTTNAGAPSTAPAPNSSPAATTISS